MKLNSSSCKNPKKPKTFLFHNFLLKKQLISLDYWPWLHQYNVGQLKSITMSDTMRNLHHISNPMTYYNKHYSLPLEYETKCDILIISLSDTHFNGKPMVIQARYAHYLKLVTTHSIYNQWKSRRIGNVWEKSVLTDKISF